MASSTNPSGAPTTGKALTEDAFTADRKEFLSSFLGFTLGAVVVVVVILVLLALFLT